MRELTVIEAVREALAEEMARDERVIVLGEDVGKLGGVFRATEGLFERFGAARVVDMPMAETVIAGVSVGLAMRGLRPVAEIQFADFIHAAMDHSGRRGGEDSLAHRRRLDRARWCCAPRTAAGSAADRTIRRASKRSTRTRRG